MKGRWRCWPRWRAGGTELDICTGQKTIYVREDLNRRQQRIIWNDEVNRLIKLFSIFFVAEFDDAYIQRLRKAHHER